MGAHDQLGADTMPAISFSDPAIQHCPFLAYHKLRDEQPVYRDPVTGHYVLTRYADIRRVLLKPKLFRSSGEVERLAARPEIGALFAAKGWRNDESFQALNDPEHRAIRSLVDKAFARWNIQAIHPFIEGVIAELIDTFEARGECEFVAEFAVGLTMKLIASQLGVAHDDPIQFQQDSIKLRAWSDYALELVGPGVTPERQLELVEHAIDFQHFCVANIDRVRAAPDDTLLSKLVEVVVDEKGEPDIPQLLATMRVLLVAGNETTRFSLTAGVKALIDDPALALEIRDDPVKIDAFVEEVLRVHAPVQTLFRTAAEDVEINGTTIPSGARIEVRFGAANRDPSIYAHPEKIDLNRPAGQPHIAFGTGIHVCIGMELARAELRLGFRHLLHRLENLRAARGDDSYDYTPIYISWGVTRLDMRFDKRTVETVRR